MLKTFSWKSTSELNRESLYLPTFPLLGYIIQRSNRQAQTFSPQHYIKINKIIKLNININNIVTEINVKEKAKHNIASNNKRIPIIKIIY